jgi:hypothetical protein
VQASQVAVVRAEQAVQVAQVVKAQAVQAAQGATQGGPAQAAQAAQAARAAMAADQQAKQAVVAAGVAVGVASRATRAVVVAQNTGVTPAQVAEERALQAIQAMRLYDGARIAAFALKDGDAAARDAAFKRDNDLGVASYAATVAALAAARAARAPDDSLAPLPAANSPPQRLDRLGVQDEQVLNDIGTRSGVSPHMWRISAGRLHERMLAAVDPSAAQRSLPPVEGDGAPQYSVDRIYPAYLRFVKLGAHAESLHEIYQSYTPPPVCVGSSFTPAARQSPECEAWFAANDTYLFNRGRLDMAYVLYFDAESELAALLPPDIRSDTFDELLQQPPASRQCSDQVCALVEGVARLRQQSLRAAA